MRGYIFLAYGVFYRRLFCSINFAGFVSLVGFIPGFNNSAFRFVSGTFKYRANFFLNFVISILGLQY